VFIMYAELSDAMASKVHTHLPCPSALAAQRKEVVEANGALCAFRFLSVDQVITSTGSSHERQHPGFSNQIHGKLNCSLLPTSSPSSAELQPKGDTGRPILLHAPLDSLMRW
jgi:hypothetical protein